MFKKISLKAKLISAFLAVALCLLAVGGIGQWVSRDVVEKYSHVAQVNLPNAMMLARMRSATYEIRLAVNRYAIPGNTAEQIASIDELLKKGEKEYAEADKIYNEIPFVEGEDELYKKVSSTYEPFKKITDELDDLALSKNADDRAKFLKKLSDEFRPAARDVFTALGNLIAFQKAEAEKWETLAMQTAEMGKKISTVALAIGFILALVFGILLANSLSRSLRGATVALNAGSSEVSTAVGLLAQSSGALSSAATQQAAALQETSSAIEEIRAMVETNTKNANASASSSETSKSQAEKGQAVVEEMIASMGLIQKSNQNILLEVTQSNQKFSEIAKVIQEIGNKTKVINEIVFQTKLLSFNASVEAARAGEHGKGFAVVAEEVGNLAAMSGNAAKEISDMLDGSISRVQGIVQDTMKKVEAIMADATTTVNRGNEIAHECGQVLVEIVESVTKVSGMAGDISSASQEQLSGVTEISKALHELHSATHANATAAQQMDASTEMLKSQVGTLNGVSSQLAEIVEGSASGAQKDEYARGIPVPAEKDPVRSDKVRALEKFQNSDDFEDKAA